tara:strand:+ start:764 stop:1096 length:333 start_codon:yes stop_codon:yes gene_type:complete
MSIFQTISNFIDKFAPHSHCPVCRRKLVEAPNIEHKDKLFFGPSNINFCEYGHYARYDACAMENSWEHTAEDGVLPTTALQALKKEGGVLRCAGGILDCSGGPKCTSSHK